MQIRARITTTKSPMEQHKAEDWNKYLYTLDIVSMKKKTGGVVVNKLNGNKCISTVTCNTQWEQNK